MVLKIAHRGASGYEPENTLLAFEKAIELKADMIELDVQRCKSGELIVMHDYDVRRTTNGKGLVTGLDYKAISRLHCRKKQKVPLLREVLDLADKRIKVNIEIKSKSIAQEIARIINGYITEKGLSYNDFLVSSFDYNELLDLMKTEPRIRIGMLFSKLPADYAEQVKRLKPYAIEPYYESVNEEFIKNAHKDGIKVLAWTVNDKKEIERLKGLGVDGIFSDYPDRL